MALWRKNIEDQMHLSEQDPNIGHQLGIEFHEITDDALTFKMPVDHRTHQPMGILHGGATCVLAESVGSVAAFMTLKSDDKTVVGVDLHTQHLRPVKSGFIYGTATAIHLGRTTQVWDIHIRDERDRLVAVSRHSVAVISLPKSV